ncbi:hypothetical protein [Microvirga mediterraneensis]|uniref:Uncharacterized protein n=1 Tax=Microvirga mediterraneensis TaxID=2754695 RepID=A0A838BUG6_9HYPH|nr:hypothetical protein [Microvirga mediterraneensis]MBA1158699.1 hypothetical protein [Microvirga mediterraneensis]
MKGFAAASLALVLTAHAALAAEPVFPPASRIGIVPPEDMMVSKRFSGFESEEKAAAINFVEMPAAAYGQVVSGLTKEALKRQGMSETSRENLQLGARTGVLIGGTMASPVQGRKWVMAVKDEDLTALVIAQVRGGQDGYSEAQMREALKSIALRGPVSIDEQVSALPFRLGDKAGFRPVRVMSGNSALFTDGPQDTIKAVEQPMVIVAAATNVPVPPAERRSQFARAALNSNQILKDIKIERSESFRFKGQDWHEIVATALEAESGQPIVVMQTIRFEPDRYVRLIGLTRVEQRDQNLPRFRTIIDGVDTNP